MTIRSRSIMAAFAACALPLTTLIAQPLPVAPTASDPALLATVAAKLADGPAGTRYGLLVTTMDGREVIAIAPDERFIPASNTKMFTTVTAFAQLPALDAAARGTSVRLEPVGGGKVDVILHGHGDARLSSAQDCTADCLQTLADAVAAHSHNVRNVVGDDSWFPDERWGPGMSWNNIQGRYGTGISALTLDDNEFKATVTAGAIGTQSQIAMPDYYQLQNDVMTVPGTASALTVERMPGSRIIRFSGTIGAQHARENLIFGIDDPADYAAWRMRALLRERGVRVSGTVQTRHRPLSAADDPAVRKATPAALAPEPAMLAELPPLPLAQDVQITNKVSQNLHADLFLRRVARHTGSGSIADGQAAVHHMLDQAGVRPGSYYFADGSGMSSYNRITPRAAVQLLRWVAGQSWGMDWRATLPVGGVDGTLRSRYRGTILDGKLFAKTGSLNASRALSGYMVTKSGATLVFSALANDIPDGGDSAASAAVDKALVAIAEAN